VESQVDREAREWLENVYQGDRVRQLSPRAIVSGMLIGGVMSISNLYVGLKTGWGLGVTITACIIAFAVFKALEAVVPAYRKDHFTILENNTMASAASAAGYMASAGLVSAFPALLMVTGRNLLWWEMMLWLGAVSVLGVSMAVPLKRQLINIDKLPFPSGIATAETLRSMHTTGAEAMQKAKSLGVGAGLGAMVALLRDAPFMGRFAFPSAPPLPPRALGRRLQEQLTLGFEGSLIMIAAGAIMGIRIGFSLLLGAVVYYGVIGPILIERGIAEPGYRSLAQWMLWPATAMMVTSGLLSFALRWRTVIRAFSGLTAIFGAKRQNEDPLAHIEVPGSWFLWGTLVAGAACVIMGHYLFDIDWWMGIVAVLATFLLSIVAARATGETDITPVGALGKITQLTYGVIAPARMTTNLMTASITAGAASHSADLLVDLKSGYLLGGNPRKQTIAQLFGVLAGTLLCVPVYALIVNPETLGSEDFPAPAAQVWAGVAKMLGEGLAALPPGAVMGMVVGGIIGVILCLLEEFFPKHRKWVPSPVGLGIAGVIPAFNSISMFLGSFGAWLLMKKREPVATKYTIPVSSGLIAGESLMGVGIILAAKGPEMIRAMFGS
jgi:uncharacterized oligopeptide transporter (OPT) family protein